MGAGEITDEPLSMIAADDPVTCAEYVIENDAKSLPRLLAWILRICTLHCTYCLDNQCES